jgi:RHS repeat-associated protein
MAIGIYASPLTDGITRGQTYAYDLSGKRTSMQWLPGTTGYTYNDFGALEKITDPNTNQYTIGYTLDGHVASMALGTGVTETRAYDFDGRLKSRSRQSSFPNLGTLTSNTLTYDRLNRVIHSVEQSFGQQQEDTKIAYDGLGAVLANEQTNGFSTNVEEFRNDALGNILYRKTQKGTGNNAPFVMQYSPLGELLTSFSHLSSTPGQNERDDQLKQNFLSGGQLNREDRIERSPGADVNFELATKHYYGADDKVMAVQRYSFRTTALRDGTWEEYWYDALGRRVLTRARRDPATIYPATFSGPLCAGGIQCRSFTERVWWDGDQALVEERTAEGISDPSNSGLVQNIHGLTLDEPLAVITDQTTRIVNYNWRGLGESSVFPTGEAADASLGNPVAEIDWPAATQADTYFAPGPIGSASGGNPKKWMGTFVANGVGTTGMLYRRNRYFNPSSGQFTQADPVGIAGGMNAFGFAAGDPVNYSDAFGLCPPCYPDQPGFRKTEGGARTGVATVGVLLAMAALPLALEAGGIWLAGSALAPALPKLSNDLAATFEEGKYTAQRLTSDMRVYRVFDEVSAAKVGRWFTTSAQASSRAAQGALNLYNNAATRMVEAVIPKGTTVYSGAVAGSTNGATQVLVPNAQAVRFGAETVLKP